MITSVSISLVVNGALSYSMFLLSPCTITTALPLKIICLLTRVICLSTLASS